MIPVRGLVALHQGINNTPQHQQAAVDAGGLTLLLPLSTRLGQALATYMNSTSGLWGATVQVQVEKVMNKEPERQLLWWCAKLFACLSAY